MFFLVGAGGGEREGIRGSLRAARTSSPHANQEKDFSDVAAPPRSPPAKVAVGRERAHGLRRGRAGSR